MTEGEGSVGIQVEDLGRRSSEETCPGVAEVSPAAMVTVSIRTTRLHSIIQFWGSMENGAMFLS